MLYDLRDTIVAIASAAGGAARGIVRLSGPDVIKLLTAAITRSDFSADVPSERATIYHGSLPLTHWGRELPVFVYLWPTARSYTRQPAAELHTLGSPPLLAAAVEELCRHGARPAEPGEFTLRAFLAGRIDLTQAEAVLGVIDAQGAEQLAAALAQLAGGLADPLGRLRGHLLDLLARLEASLDFAAEDIELITAQEIAAELSVATTQLDALSVQIGSRGEASDVVRVVLVGLPNAGKSSLFNALAGAAAIVSDQPGTTRDYLTARVDFGGIPCELVDTAGIESAGEGPSPHAQRHASEQAARAAIRLICLDAAASSTDGASPTILDSDRQIAVLTKCDLAGSLVTDRQPAGLSGKAVATSVRTSVGLDILRRRIGEAALSVTVGESSSVAATAARAAHSVRQASEALARTRSLNDHRAGDELIAAEIRLALDELGKVSGAVTTDDVLDRIFSRFCIGK
jgi:tRNA modification GTPase